MSYRKKSKTFSYKIAFINFLFLLFAAAADVAAQMSAVPVPTPEDGGSSSNGAANGGESFVWWYLTLLVLAVGLAGAIFWMLKSRRERAKNTQPKKNRKTDEERWEINSLDANKELEWLRKNQKLVGKNGKKTSNRKSVPANGFGQTNFQSSAANNSSAGKNEAETMLPIFEVERVERARPFSPLPLSNDEALMSAIEQAHEEFEEDEAVRDLALRILQAFKTRNSVEALSQMALYDLSSPLRSKAVNALADFNHESVFEFILLASADPTREVRAAAARSLSKLTFDRADAWTRIFESDEPGRIGQAARAAIESGFVEMSFDRLVHQDKKYSYEAFALMALLIKAGETEPIFKALETHKNMNVRRAILHVVKVTKDERAVENLCKTLESGKLPLDLQQEADKTIEEIGFVTV